jgi:hypothetical protein
MTDTRRHRLPPTPLAEQGGWVERAEGALERAEEAVDEAVERAGEAVEETVERVEEAVDEAAESLWHRYLAAAREHRVWVLFPSFLSLVVEGLSWLIPRTHVSAILVLLLLALLFVLQLWLADKTARGSMRLAAMAFGAALFYFAVFGSAYSLYASFGGHQQIFFSDRLGEAYFISTSMGTGTGTLFGLHLEAAPDVTLAVIMHMQLVVLAVAVAISAGLALAKITAAIPRARTHTRAGDREADPR